MKKLCINSAYNRKILFDKILSKKNINCKYRIEVRYEWQKPNQICTCSLSSDGVIRLCININIGYNSFFCDFDDADTINIRYRAYHISEYIDCLIDAFCVSPDKYLYGCVLLCAINDILNKNRALPFPLIYNRMSHNYRVIDAYCSIRALERIVSDYKDQISTNSINVCNDFISVIDRYLYLPEIEYKQSHSMYTIMLEFKQLQSNITKRKRKWFSFPLLEDLGIPIFEDVAIDKFVEACYTSKNLFWQGVSIRLITYCGKINKEEIKQLEYIEEGINCYREESMRFYNKIKGTNSNLLNDNFDAIKHMVRMMDKTICYEHIESGSIHYYI